MNKMDAEAWLASEYRIIERDEWTPPEVRAEFRYQPGTTVAEYAEEWMASHKRRDGRPLKARTVEHYRSLLRLRILPHLGGTSMRSLTEERVSHWFEIELPRDTPVANAHAYALLSEILRAASKKDPAVAPPVIVRTYIT